jgi:diaminopimelate epimerase
MKKTFVKMHGLGNDFAIFDARAGHFDLTAEQIRFMGHRQTGIGFDQIVVIYKPVNADTVAFVRIYNADGSEVGACGNASRCVAYFLNKELKKNQIIIETKATKLVCEPRGDLWSVDMGPVRTEWQDIPLASACDALSIPITLENLPQPVGVNVGNPHAVFFMDDLRAVDVARLGPLVEHHPLFPERVNVEFAQIIGPGQIRMTVWERGAGMTLACGTGACATAIAAIRRELMPRGPIEILQKGGSLTIDWRENDNHVLMTGPVAEVFRGEVEL